MRKFIFIAAIVVGLFYLVKGFIVNGDFDRFLDKTPNAEVEYYWGKTLSLFGQHKKAEYRFNKIFEIHSKTKYDKMARIAYMGMLGDMGFRKEVMAQGEIFLEKYPEGPEAETVRKRIKVIQYGI